MKSTKSKNLGSTFKKKRFLNVKIYALLKNERLSKSPHFELWTFLSPELIPPSLWTFSTFCNIFFQLVPLAVGLSKIRVPGFRRNLGCAQYAQSWVFFQNFQNIAFLLLYYSASKKATAMVFI